ncbi:WD40-repeat-containing domain protein [Elsinoe ampelina]|uniref:WD40-repeat-containing domain protein n=1 Tax=Elsinoe ampelina TaxID=302913 RepID=A0A6A6GDK0_9PEZI|nr:WD40-repeat-containing domain protein [Elsinoe ampelina]
MDVHRSRFVPYPASPISAIAFSRTNDNDVPDPKPALKLAIGRADGSIELWNPGKANWVQEVVFPGSEGSSIEGLVWTQDPNEVDPSGNAIVGQLRLFSIDSTAAVTEWNLSTGRPQRISTGNFSEVWCIAAQPRQRLDYAAKGGEWTGQDIVVGCGDGTLALLTTAEDDLTFKRFLARSGSKKTRCMSVAWQNRDTVVAGFSDSSVRIYDVRSGSIVRTMSLGTGVPGASKNVLVWRIKCLPNGDIVSADSNGQVIFWNGKTYSMSQRIAGHDSDCLDIVTSTDGQTVFSGGIDGKVAVYKVTDKDGNKRKWAKLSHRRIHQGDLKSMAVYDSKQMSVVVTGGADTVPSVMPLKQLNKENHRRLPGLPQRQPLVSAPHVRLLVSWWERSVSIWRIGPQESFSLAPSVQSRKLVGGVTIKGEDNVAAVAISADGRVLSVATATATKLFQLRSSRDPADPRLRCRSVTLPADISSTGSRLLNISPDGRWLTQITMANEILVHRIIPSAENPKHIAVVPQHAELARVFRKKTSQCGLGKYESTITQAVFAPDTSLFCVADLAGHVETFALNGELSASAAPAERVKPIKARGKKTPVKKRPNDSDSDDSSSSSEDEDDLPLAFYGQSWTTHPSAEKLPKLDSQALIMAFHPEAGLESLLFVVTQHHQVYELDIQKGKLSDWSRRNPTSVFPPEWRGIKDRAMGLVWDFDSTGAAKETSGKRQARAWLYGSSWLGMLDISQEFASTQVAAANGPTSTELVASGKRKRLVEELPWASRTGDRRSKKGRSGAGDQVRDAEKGGFVAPIAEAAKSEDEDVDAMDVDEDLGPLRRIDESEAEDSSSKETDEKQRRRWWCTYKYRPILGVAPLSREAPIMDGIDGGNALQKRRVKGFEREPMEVVLVERPHWDLEHLQR